MQDEVNEKTMALCIKGGKISAQILKAALTKLLAEIEKKKQQSKKMGGQNRCKRGKQSIRSLQQSGAQLTNIVVTDNNIKSFDRVARKYGIDYSLKKAEKEGNREKNKKRTRKSFTKGREDGNINGHSTRETSERTLKTEQERIKHNVNESLEINRKQKKS